MTILFHSRKNNLSLILLDVNDFQSLQASVNLRRGTMFIDINSWGSSAKTIIVSLNNTWIF